MGIAKANYNMRFDEGDFRKGRNYEYENVGKGVVYVTTEQGKKQEFYFPEFDTLFTILKN